MAWRRVVRAGLLGVLGTPLVVVGTLVGILAALFYTPPGRDLTARVLTDVITGMVHGDVEIGKLRGNILNHIVLENVVIRDSVGALVISAPRLEVRYFLLELLAKRIVLRELRIERPVIHLVQAPSGSWNWQKVFQGEGGPRTGPPPLVELRDVVLSQASIRLDVPARAVQRREPMTRNSAPPVQPEVVQSADGLMRVRRFEQVNARFPLIRVSTPSNDPILIRIDALAAQLSDPRITVVDLQGEVITKGDSLRFDIQRAQLPGSELRGSGIVRTPGNATLYDYTLTAESVSLADLRFISPDFPDWRGSGRVIAHSVSARRTEYQLESLSLGSGNTTAAGRLVAVVDDDRGFGVRGLDMALRAVPMSVTRPYLDTLPVDGVVSGRLRADGFSDRMTTSGEIRFTDALAPGAPVSDLRFDGAIRFGGIEGAVFESFALRDTRMDLATISVLVPSVTLPGDLRLIGRLDGPWQNAQFQGTAEHHAPNGALSRMTGTVRMDTRGEVMGLSMDMMFDALSFDALRTGYPSLSARGVLTGRVTAEGPLTALDITADVTGDIGTIVASGRVILDSPRLGADSLVLDMQRLDVDALLGQGTNTALSGHLVVSGEIGEGVKPRGTVHLELGTSRVGGITFGEILGDIASDGSRIAVDNVTAVWPDGRILADGSLGWTTSESGRLLLKIDAESLAPFDSLVRATLALTPDSVPHPLSGRANVDAQLSGSLEHLAINATVEAKDVVLDQWRIGDVSTTITSDSLGSTDMRVVAEADSVGLGTHLLQDIVLSLDGDPRAMRFAASANLLAGRFGAGGHWSRSDNETVVTLDSLTADLPRQDWRLVEPVTVAVTDQVITLRDTLALRTTNGSGAITLSGTVPGTLVGELEAEVVGLELGDLYALMERDTTAVAGLASVDLRLAGTRDAPTFRGNASVTGPRFGEVHPPLARAVFDYENRLLRSQISFWKTGESILEVNVSLPLDLALAAREQRRLPGEIEITAMADSADLAVLEAFTTSIRNTYGFMKLDMRASGTWDRPQFEGVVAIRDGRTTIPALGRRYEPIQAQARFTGESLVIDSLVVGGGDGVLNTNGTITFPELTSAVLDLNIVSSRFLAMDVPGLFTLRTNGTVQLRGPLLNATLTGNMTLNESVVYFADFLTKDVVNLEDPMYAGLVDTLKLREQGLGAAFQSRFLDSLSIQDLRFRAGTEVFLRSSEANIQLEGEVIVNKTKDVYALVGSLNTPRGVYTLKIGPFSRDFDVKSGTVRYSGSLDLNAELDVEAEYLVTTTDGDEIPILAQIEGTIQVPKVTLSSPGTNIPARDLISYLMFGRPEFQVAAGGSSTQAVALAQAAQAALGIVSGEVERLLLQDGGLGIDLFEIRPSITSGTSAGAGLTRLVAGWQLGSRWFVTFNAGFCFGGQQAERFSTRNFGASIEYRFAREWKLQGSAEPVQNCVASQIAETNIRRYQLGGDLLWQRDY